MPETVGEVLSYGHCRLCAALEPTAILLRTGKICEACIGLGLAPVPTTVRVGGENVRMNHPSMAGKSSKGSRASRNRARAAQKAAMKRLRDAFPEMYLLMYAEERANRGLPAVPLSSKRFDGEAHSAAMRAAGERHDFDQVYAAVGASGIEVD